MEITKRGATAVVREFREHRLAEDGRERVVDHAFFESLVEGAVADQREVDQRISAVLAEGWRLERPPMRPCAPSCAVAAFELLHRPDVPVLATIDSYVGIAHAFFEGPEPGFINGALDSLARDARREEFDAARRDG